MGCATHHAANIRDSRVQLCTGARLIVASPDEHRNLLSLLTQGVALDERLWSASLYRFLHQLLSLRNDEAGSCQNTFLEAPELGG